LLDYTRSRRFECPSTLKSGGMDEAAKGLLQGLNRSLKRFRGRENTFLRFLTMGLKGVEPP